jgi:hypothetical protein
MAPKANENPAANKKARTCNKNKEDVIIQIIS